MRTSPGWPALFSAGLCLVLAAASWAETFQAGPWRVEVTVTPDQPTVMLGEPTWLSFVVRNVSTEPLQILVGGDDRNQLGRPSSFEVKTVRRDGKWVSQPEAGLSSGGLIGPQDLPAGESFVFRLFVPHWATFQETGSYTIACRRTLQLLRPAAGDFRQQPITEIVADARTPLIVEPGDARRMGERVRELGETMLEAGGEKPGDDATVALAWIDDSRVAAYFRRALAIRSYALRFIAVQVLAKFSTDEAFEGLKVAMQMNAADFDYAAGEQQPLLAAQLRAAAAGALSRCQHPGARAFLLAQRHDESENVRLTVLHALGRLPLAQALPVLQEMTRDQSARVSEVAQRYVALLRRRADPAEAQR